MAKCTGKKNFEKFFVINRLYPCHLIGLYAYLILNSLGSYKKFHILKY